MMNADKFRAAGAVAMVTMLAGCQAMSGPPMRGGPMTPAPMSSAVEGDWVSTDGVAISRFNNGIFETLATDTGNKLAEGTYTQIDPTNVSISVTSLIRQTTSQVNCALVAPTQLNCTSSAGQQFSLMRRPGSVS